MTMTNKIINKIYYGALTMTFHKSFYDLRQEKLIKSTINLQLHATFILFHPKYDFSHTTSTVKVNEIALLQLTFFYLLVLLLMFKFTIEIFLCNLMTLYWSMTDCKIYVEEILRNAIITHLVNSV